MEHRLPAENLPLSRTELTLRGEIIQIGAARINDRGDVLDTFEVNLKPHIFRKLQHHIAKVTGLSQATWTRACR